MTSLAQDVRYAARTLARSPGFVAVVIVTLAVGIGATTAIFSVVRGVLLRPLPFREPDRLVRIFDDWHQFQRASVSVPEVVDFRAQSETLEGLAAYTSTSGNLSGEGESARVSIGLGQENYLPLLGVTPALGRGFDVGEDQPGRDHVLLLTDGFWRSRYGGDRTVIGKTVRIDEQPYTIVGVLPESFICPGGCEMWGPLAFARERYGEDRRGNHNLRVVARLKPGVTLAQVQSELDRIGKRLRILHPAAYPADSGWNPVAVPLLEQMVGDVRPSLWMLVGAAALVLLIACANVANLLLARGATRVREMSLRAALGAGRIRLMRQLLTESLALSLVGGLAGFLLALWGVDLLLGLAPSKLPRIDEVKIDGLVLAFSIGLTGLTGVLFGLLPALQTSRVDLHDALRAGVRVSSGKRPRRLRRALVVAEVALAIVLVTGAGLVTRSFANVLGVDAGFPVDHLLTMRVTLPGSNDFDPTPEERARFTAYFTAAVERLAHLPGVRSAGAIDVLPFDAFGSDSTFGIEGQPTPPTSMSPDEESRTILPGTFETLGVPLLAGRNITFADSKDAMPVLLVNQAFARKYWKDGDALGKRITFDTTNPTWITIVGIVGNVHAFGLDAEVKPEMYVPLAQLPFAGGTFSLLVRSTVPEAQIIRLARAALLTIDARPAVYDVKPMSQVLGQSLERRRFVLVLFELFGALALTLAAIGLYGVMAHSVAQRTHEIGVRIALGAQRADVISLVAREGALLTVGGLLLGAGAALVAGRLLAGLLYQVSPNDPLALGAAAVLLGAAAALATYVPVRRAMRVDPMQALRDE